MKTYGSIFVLIFLLLPGIIMASPEGECVAEVVSSNGFFSLGNILLIAGVLIVFIACGLMWALLNIPIGLLKPLILIGGVLCYLYGHAEIMSIPAGVYGLVSALLLGGFILWVFAELNISEGVLVRLMSFMLFIIWSAIAINYESLTVAFGAIMALALIISSFEATSLITGSFGLRDDGYSNGAVIAGIGILAFYLLIRKLSLGWYPHEVFETSALAVGGIAAGAGLLYNGFRFTGGGGLGYWWNQLMSVCFALFAVFVGSCLQADDLEKIGGTFLFLFIIEKVIDLVTLMGNLFIGIIIIALAGIGLIYFGIYIHEHASFYGNFLYFL